MCFDSPLCVPAVSPQRRQVHPYVLCLETSTWVLLLRSLRIGASTGQGHKKVAVQNPTQFDQVRLRCTHLAVLMHTRRLQGGVVEIELSLGLSLGKL